MQLLQPPLLRAPDLSPYNTPAISPINPHLTTESFFCVIGRQQSDLTAQVKGLKNSEACINHWQEYQDSLSHWEPAHREDGAAT